MQNVLIAYASKYGSTGEIAAVIQQELTEQGFSAQMLPVEMLDRDSLGHYDAVILGSAIYMDQWLPSAKAFVTAHQAELMARPLWVFASGPTGNGPLIQTTLPAPIAKLIDPLSPRDVCVFHGKLNPKVLTFAERMLLRIMHPAQGDFRNWEAVRQWSADIAADLLLIPV